MKKQWVLPFTILLILSLPLGAQESRDGGLAPEEARKIWNRVFSRGSLGYSSDVNAFLAEVVADLPPGKALDIGMGQGRNSLYLAEQGWDVTGFDISDEAVDQARAAARKRGLEMEVLAGDVNKFDYGKKKWDLVVAMYMHGLIMPHTASIIESLKPGGMLVIEGFHRDLNRESVQGGHFGFRSNELLRAFDGLRVLHYQDLVERADWGDGAPNPIVRLAARKEEMP